MASEAFVRDPECCEDVVLVVFWWPFMFCLIGVVSSCVLPREETQLLPRAVEWPK